MNTTRLVWTNTFKCHLKHVDDILVVITGTIILLIPAVFYLTLYMTSRAKDKKIIFRKYHKFANAAFRFMVQGDDKRNMTFLKIN